jgi:3-hydroxyacyl-CoA dehydrogenase / 3-hydroxy-2-methylbutyryl-CoA dehydrogenase
MKINGKTAIVTGGASGLGRATVEALHAEGANIVIADMNPVNGQAVVDTLKERVVFTETNITATETIKAAIDKAMDSYGHIDILINCAGTGSAMKTVGKNGPHDLNVFKGVCDINIIGTFDFIRQAAEKMQANEPDENGERGVIVNTSSVAAFDGQIGQAAYAASKAAIVGMTLTIARDMGRAGVRCCTICPGVFDTPLMALAPEEVKAGISANIPFPKRLGKAPEFAALATHIVENVYLNGETIRLDGAVRMPQR